MGQAILGKLSPRDNIPLIAEKHYYLNALDGAIWGGHFSLVCFLYEKIVTTYSYDIEIYNHIITIAIPLAARKGYDQIVNFLIHDNRIPKHLDVCWIQLAIGYCQQGNLSKLQEILPKISIEDDIYYLIDISITHCWKHIFQYLLETFPDYFDYMFHRVMECDVMELFAVIASRINIASSTLIRMVIENVAPNILREILPPVKFRILYLIRALEQDDWKNLANILIDRYSSRIINQTLNSPNINIYLSDTLVLQLIELGGTDFTHVLNMAIRHEIIDCLPILLSRVGPKI